MSYSRRVDRPGADQVNPIKRWSTPLISQFGNIDLRPQFTNSIEVNYTRNLKDRKGSITGGVFYRVITDEINRALFIDRSDINSGKIIMIRDNFEDTSAFGIELSTNYRPTKWWSMNGSFDIYSQTQKGIAERLTAPIETATLNDITTDVKEVDNVAWNFRLFNNFKATKTLTFTAFGFYRGKEKGLQFDVEPMYFVNIGARINVMEGKGTFSLGYNDIFDTQRFAATGKQPFEQEVEFNWESNTIQVGFSYRFGGGKYRAKSRKRRDNNEISGDGGGF
jgi:outer membrane receptor protein involved in Fe transport